MLSLFRIMVDYYKERGKIWVDKLDFIKLILIYTIC